MHNCNNARSESMDSNLCSRKIKHVQHFMFTENKACPQRTKKNLFFSVCCGHAFISAFTCINFYMYQCGSGVFSVLFCFLHLRPGVFQLLFHFQYPKIVFSGVLLTGFHLLHPRSGVFSLLFHFPYPGIYLKMPFHRTTDY